MSLLNKLYWAGVSVLTGIAVGAIVGAATPDKSLQKKPETYQKQLTEKQTNKIKPDKTKEKTDLEQKTLKIFDDYKDARYQQYDSLIIKYTKFWNNEFRNLPDYTSLEPDIVKSMLIQESGSPADIDAWNHDPMQIANRGDYALNVLKHGLENFIPENGYEELQNISETGRKDNKCDYSDSGITPELSIKYGIRWLLHKAIKFGKDKKPAGMRTIREGVARYNGGGTENYAEDVFGRK